MEKEVVGYSLFMIFPNIFGLKQIFYSVHNFVIKESEESSASWLSLMHFMPSWEAVTGGSVSNMDPSLQCHILQNCSTCHGPLLHELAVITCLTWHLDLQMGVFQRSTKGWIWNWQCHFCSILPFKIITEPSQNKGEEITPPVDPGQQGHTAEELTGTFFQKAYNLIEKAVTDRIMTLKT